MGPRIFNLLIVLIFFYSTLGEEEDSIPIFLQKNFGSKFGNQNAPINDGIKNGVKGGGVKGGGVKGRTRGGGYSKGGVKGGGVKNARFTPRLPFYVTTAPYQFPYTINSDVETFNPFKFNPTKSALPEDCPQIPNIKHGHVNCSKYSGCQIKCQSEYQFPIKDKNERYYDVLSVRCEDGQWIPVIDGLDTIPRCEPICNPKCQNKGICTAPGKCNCPSNFEGSYCQKAKQMGCPNSPNLPPNSHGRISSERAKIMCDEDHTFPDGSTATDLICENGEWRPARKTWKVIPECKPVCNPPCQNSGRCSAFNTCTCPEKFVGPRCQYSIEVCSPKKLKFNGNTACSGDSTLMKCKLSCPQGIKMDFTPAEEYTCFYSIGAYTPSPIPKCLYPENAIISKNSSYSSSYGEYNTTGKLIIKTYLPESGTCFTWGRGHYKTFDGRVFTAPSKCFYTLVKDAIDGTFSATVGRNPECSNNPKFCYKTLKIYTTNGDFFLKKTEDGAPIFATKNKILPIPTRFKGVTVEMAGHFVILSVDAVGVVFKWDTEDLIQVEASKALWNRTEGLCGKLDGNPNNDLLTKTGIKPNRLSLLASSWKADELDATCEDDESERIACDKGLEAKADEFCSSLITNEKFLPCQKAMDINLLKSSCMWDYCSCQKQDPRECACESMNVFVRECSFKGVKHLSNWRDKDTCPMRCTGGKIYSACGPEKGQKMCGEAPDQPTSDKCTEGCYCPEGTVLHDNECITIDQCPCRLRGKYYPPGHLVPKDCNRCKCESGKWECSELECGGRCTGWGDPHYNTFDGKKYDFMGRCSYYLVKTDNFTVEGENVACEGAYSEGHVFAPDMGNFVPSCTKSLTIRIAGNEIKLKQRREVLVNGREVAKLPFKIGTTTIRQASSIHLQVELLPEVFVWWDGLNTFHVDLPKQYVKKTAGLCGTFTRSQKTDFLTPEGDVEQAVIPFANKWKTSEQCEDLPVDIVPDPCIKNMERKSDAEKYCSYLKSLLFSRCHDFVDPDDFYKTCLYDMCSCNVKKISDCLCSSIATYAQECASKGIHIDWRNNINECSVKCEGGQKYQVCGNSCTRTCYDIATRPQCKQVCVEGCNCPFGETLNENGECIPIGQCKCQHDGVEFPPDYKEIRPGTKGQQLCVCLNAQWDCMLATAEDLKTYPHAEDARNKCKSSLNFEFTSCESVEQKTCRNMHSFEETTPAVCHPGCKCKEGFVFNSKEKRCIRPEECPCHHGGKSYKENSIIKNDCNTCKCQNGRWNCTDKECNAECSAWGDSHYKTFDDKHYDFQGQCNYVLAKGNLNEHDNFDISIQNVPCGTLGTSCSKSVTIRVGSGKDQEQIKLTSGEPLPEYTAFKHALLRERGVFVIVEIPDLDLHVHWDKATRVYVRISPKWKSKVTGLCGNYNDDDMDDFQTPSGGVTEVSANIFGDSWRLQPYCPETKEIRDTCDQRPERRVWAYKQCGVLKSSVFAPCHSEVPLDHYFDKCVFDSCACDQGGDCECLCTALAAYAQECSNRGVTIKWRTPSLCPMQCDEKCSNYSPCISTCPVETCDNLLANKRSSKTCVEDSCIEGCKATKECPEGEVFQNSSFTECVPREICKPVCMQIDDVTYYEGDRMEEDACHSCHCSLGQKVCVGKPCTMITTTTPFVTKPDQNTEEVNCNSGWTEWINQDVAKTKSSKKVVDVEPLPTPVIMNNLKSYSKCNIKNMVGIECRTVSDHVPAKETGLDVECSLERGLICQSSTKGKSCPDFEIRVLCQCEPTTTTLMPVDTTTPTVLRKKKCKDGLFYDRCAIKCDQLCSYYEYILRKNGLCKDGRICEPGCIPKRQTCPPGMLWLDENNCVAPKDCMCYDKSGNQVKPGEQREESKCVNCQCVSNHYTCQDNCDNETTSKPTYTTPGASEINFINKANISTGAWIYNYSDNKSYLLKTTIPIQSRTLETTATPLEKKTTLITETTIVDFMNNGNKSTGSWNFQYSQNYIYGLNTTTTIQPIILVTTVTPPENCTEDFIDLLKNLNLPDQAFTASSSKGPGYLPQYGQISANTQSNSAGSWSPEISDENQFLQIDLGHQEPIYGIKIKGSALYDEYVTRFQVLYSPDGNTFYSVLDEYQWPKVFRGSVDSSTIVKNTFITPIEAKVVKIIPKSWHEYISMRVELIGCGTLASTTEAEYTTISANVDDYNIACQDNMGPGEAMMSDQQITVSSEINRSHGPAGLKINKDSYWQPHLNSPTEFVQFDFLDLRNVTGFKTKGGDVGWVTTFKVEFSVDGAVWNKILDSGKEKVFLGNVDYDSLYINKFKLPIQTKLLRIYPVTWFKAIQLRIEILGCYAPYKDMHLIYDKNTTFCTPCKGVIERSSNISCNCVDGKLWNGKACVDKDKCPCIEDKTAYAVGATYQTQACEECTCKMGGTSHCTKKICPSCSGGQRSILNTNCECICKPCPVGTKICPTSNTCIKSTLWCDGVQDCPDDEVNCLTTTTPVYTTTQKPLTLKECPVYNCPPDFVKVKKKSRNPQPSRWQTKSWFQKIKEIPGAFTKGVKGAIKSIRRPINEKVFQLPKPKTSNHSQQFEAICPEYTCVPAFPIPSYNACLSVDCPPKYKPIYEINENICQYTCDPPPPPDSVCSVKSRTFSTFDNTEFMYDICNHVLARDLVNYAWDVSLKKVCREKCSRDLIIRLGEHTLVLESGLEIEYDGYKYSLEQAKQIGKQTGIFEITHLGNSYLVTSNSNGFWVVWDKFGNVDVGVSYKLKEKVDGLCGYFNEIPNDDKRKPDGSKAKTTQEFGDSWALDHYQPEICQSKSCPSTLQNAAWEICNKERNRILKPCTDVINLNSSMARCLESTCECLQASKSPNQCKCDALQSIVVECLRKRDLIELSDWRTEASCPATCEAPLVYHDCYRRRCEPTCETLSKSYKCPQEDEFCTSGCFCPSGMVRKGSDCIEPSGCRDCECNVLPNLEYVTYDDANFTINGNCVYVVTRDQFLDQSETKKHNFQVLVTNAPCMDDPNKMCAGKITVLYKDHKIHILRGVKGGPLKLIVDGERIEDFSELSQWMNVTVQARGDLKLTLTEAQVEVIVHNHGLGVTTHLPSYKYSGKLEGLCGDCNREAGDDLRTPDGRIVTDVKEFVLSWLYENLPGGQSKEMCDVKPVKTCDPLPQDKDPCLLIKDPTRFGKCHPVVDSALYIEWCKTEVCNGEAFKGCAAIEAYAAKCRDLGICVDWRNDICPAQDCPVGKVYQPCGTACPKTCDMVKEGKTPQCSLLLTEGCFCPDEMVLRNKTCVPEKDCITCDPEGHKPGDKWSKDECTTCTCEGTSVTCQTEQCPDINSVCGEGFKPIIIKTQTPTCCPKYSCAAIQPIKTTCEPPRPITCEEDQVTKVNVNADGCQKFICECKPATDCPKLNMTTSDLEPGYIKEQEHSGCCPKVKIVCKTELCPKPIKCPQYYILKKIKEGKCCPEYRCEEPVDKCIYENSFINDESGGERRRTELEKHKVLKEPNATWLDGPCRECICAIKSPNAYEASCTKKDCPSIDETQDVLDYKLEYQPVPGECCPLIVRVACKHGSEIIPIGQSWQEANDYCVSYTCIQLPNGLIAKEKSVKTCETCKLGYKYVKPNAEEKTCCGSCKPKACVVDGNVYEINQVWTSKDFCISYKCADQNGTLQVISEQTTCPEVPLETLNDYQVDFMAQDNQCCKKPVITACKQGDKVYKINETWPSPDGDKCKTLSCVKNSDLSITKKETVLDCKKSCDRGYTYKESETSCCGECRQVACIFEDRLIKESETLKTPDGCTTYSCLRNGDNLYVTSSSVTCPDIAGCNEKNVYVDGCCKRCNLTVYDQDNCKPQAMPLEQTVGIVKRARPGKGICVNKVAIEGFMQCDGKCSSGTIFKTETGTFGSFCKCCQAVSYITKKVATLCDDGTLETVLLNVPSKCDCMTCGEEPSKKGKFTKTGNVKSPTKAASRRV